MRLGVGVVGGTQPPVYLERVATKHTLERSKILPLSCSGYVAGNYKLHM